jgi:hypothetical protein
MSVKLAPQPRQQYEIAGAPASGAKLFSYAAGSTTKQTTYTTSVGDVANTNPIILNSEGRTPYGVWLTTGLNYKFVLAPSTDTDPPTSPIFSEDVVSGINDTAAPTTSQWNDSGLTPTFVSTTQFTLIGDQTTNFHVGRRLKLVNTAGTLYGQITVSAYTALTTITVVLDSGVLDAGLSSVAYGVLTASESAIPLSQTIHAATNKTTPVGADELGIWDSVTTALNRLSFTNLVAYLSALCSAGWNAFTATKSGIPQNSKSAAYTTVLADANKHILHPTADNNARTFTIDSNANVAYDVGTTITFVNQINTVTIAITTDTMTLASAGTTGSRTLAANGIATAIKIAATSWMISGSGLS